MKLDTALAEVSHHATGSKTNTLYDDILAMLDVAEKFTDDVDVATACVRAMMRNEYSGLEVIAPFLLEDEGDWHVLVRHFDGTEVGIAHES